jgi:ABC-2 type transport system permease protein
MSYIMYCLRVIVGCMKKEIRTALTERAALFQTIILPINYNLLLILFVLSGSNAPTAVVMQDTGYYAQQFYNAMDHSYSFALQQTSASTANKLMAEGEIVAIVTIPSDFDSRLLQGKRVQVGLLTNNLNTDMTDDVNRGLRLSVTTFYAHQFPNQVSVVPQEDDAYTRQIDYIPFLSVSVLVIGLLVGGLLQSGTSAARDWELATIKELLLSPAPRWAIVVGKTLGSGVMGLLSSCIVLGFIVGVIGDQPAHWGILALSILLMSTVFVAAGTLIGNLMRHRQTVTLLVRGVSVPLFFLSGVFNPVTYSTLGVIILSRLFPVHYAVVLEQYAFLNYHTNVLEIKQNMLVLLGFLLLFITLAAIVLKRSKVAQ